MIPAVKMLDPVMGVDIHIIMVPTPGGPVPTPIPHPFTGMVFDPMDLLPILGASVLVNNMPRAQAGTAAIAVPPHIPIGGPFMKPPANEGEMFMGSATVLVEDEPFTYMGLPVLSCNDIGVPPPPRPNKKGGTNSMVLPTSVVLSIPAGMPVLVGGPPTISLTAIGMRVGMAALGKAAKKLKGLQKKSKKMKAISDKIHNAAKKGMDKLGVPPSIQNKVHKGICSVTGHPVDIASGKVFTDIIDFELPGPIPITWERTWYSTSVYDGPIGHGWHHPYDLAMEVDLENEAIAVRLADGRPLAFPLLEVGEEVFSRAEKLTLFRDKEGYALRDKSYLSYRFGPHKQGTHRLMRIENTVGQAIRFDYDRNGYLQEMIDSVGRVLHVDTDHRGRIVAIHAPHPEQSGTTYPIVRYRYDAASNMTESVDALNQSMHYAYRGHLLIQETDRNGLSFYFTYDGHNHHAKCLRTWGDGGIYDHKLTYAGGLTMVENSLGHTASYYHDGSLVHHTIDNLGHSSFVEFNEYNEVILETDPLERQTGYAYDERGNRTAIFYPDGSTIEMTFEEDRLIAAQDQIGGSYTWLYNEQGQLIGRQDPLGQSTAYRYKGPILEEVIGPDAEITSLEFDHRLNLVQLTSPDGSVNRWKYDNLGNLRVSIDPKENVQRRRHDLLGRVIQVDEPDGNHRDFSYDPKGNLVRAKDRHHDVRFEYKGMGRLSARIENNTRVEFSYDTEEQFTGIINEHGYAYRFDLNPNGEVDLESGFDEVKRHYQRDAAGQVVTVARANGIETHYEYDEVGRIVVVEHKRGTRILDRETFAYRLDGELMAAQNEVSKIAFERDPLGQVTKEWQGDHWVSSTYDKQGLRTQVASSLGAHFQFERNIMGDTEKVSVLQAEDPIWSTHFKRDVFGQETERRFQDGVRSRWERDQLGRPVQQEVTAGGKRTRSRAYTWDVNDRLKQIIDGAHGRTEFGHDPFGNLAWAQYGGGQTEYRMPDEVGNLFRQQDRSDRKYGPAGQLLAAEGTRYEYDEEGNLIRKTEADGAIWRYEWNAAGMLTQVTRPDGDLVRFGYDPLGRRVSKSYRGYTTHWVWDGNVPLHEWVEQRPTTASGPPKIRIKSKNGITIRRKKAEVKTAPAHGPPSETTAVITWLFEPDTFAPLAKIQGDSILGIVTDHLGTPIGMYDGLETIWSADMSIYGEVRNLEGARTACPFRFPGQYEDVETGLYYNRFRYYDAEGGFYVSQDPIGLWGNNPNIYAYTKDSTIWIDPFGLETVLTSGYVYRSGSGTDNNLTPRPGKDTTSGLSTSMDKPTSGKFQTIDIAKLDEAGLEAVNDHGNHVSIRPKDDAGFKKLEDWASTRGTDVQHKYTKGLQNAKVCP